MDVKTAFLNGKLDYDIYMRQPAGFEDPDKLDYVCKLHKSIYGLKQSARCWNSTITQYLLSDGYNQCPSDDCQFMIVEEVLMYGKACQAAGALACFNFTK